MQDRIVTGQTRCPWFDDHLTRFYNCGSAIGLANGSVSAKHSQTVFVIVITV